MTAATKAPFVVGVVLLAAGCGPTGTRPHPSPVPRPTASCHLGPDGRPDPTCTPGATNPDVTQATIGRTICVPGWTATVRPPQSYTGPLKVAQIRAYGYLDTRTSSYEEDHLIPLELGGAPRDPHNLWPESHTQSGTKDAAENAAKTAVCAGTKTLAQAQAQLLADWGPAHR